MHAMQSMITPGIKNVAAAVGTAWLVEVPFPKNIKKWWQEKTN